MFSINHISHISLGWFNWMCPCVYKLGQNQLHYHSTTSIQHDRFCNRNIFRRWCWHWHQLYLRLKPFSWRWSHSLQLGQLPQEMIVQDLQYDDQTDEALELFQIFDPVDTIWQWSKTWHNKNGQLVFSNVLWPVMINYILIFLQSAASSVSKKLKWSVERMTKLQMVFYTTYTV